MFRRLSLALAITAALAPFGVQALGLGDIHPRSALNQNLEADIDVLSVAPDELDGVKVELASPEEFAKAGVDRPFFLSGLRFEPVALPNGRVVIRVTSKDSIREPFLDFLVEVNWAKGRLVREYTLLLDPPVTLMRKPQPVQAPMVSQTGAPARSPADRGTMGAPVAGALEYGPTRRNDTLWSIAKGLGAEGASVHQVMMALFQYNRGAFIRDNVNNLKVGEVLRIPQHDVVFERSREQAKAEFLEQTAVWRAERPALEVAKKKPVGIVPSVEEAPPPETAEAPIEPISEEVVAEPPAIAEAAEPEAELKLVSAQEEAESAGQPGMETGELDSALDAAQLQKDLLLAREETAMARQEGAEMRGQMGELEQRLQDMQRLLTVQNDQLAQLEEGVVEARQTQEEASRAAEEEAEAAAAETVAAEEQQGLLDRLRAGDTTVIGILVAIGVVLLTAIGALAFRRRREEKDEFEESILTTPSGLHTSEQLGDSTSPVSSHHTTQATAALSETIDAGGMGAETAQVDPLSEADVYMAYGRHEQAADLLKQELVRQPGRLDFQHKLLEIYFTMKSEEAFVRLAGEMALAGAAEADPQSWEAAIRMGQELAPDSALFGGSGSKPAKPEPAADLEAAGPSAEEEKLAEDSGLDFDLDLDALAGEPETSKAGEAEPAQKADTGLDFDIGDLTPFEPAAEKDEEREAPAADTSELDLDVFGEQPEAEEPEEESFDLGDVGGLEPPPPPRREEPEPEEPEELTLEGLETTAEVEEGGEVETKLDLAQAYLDMGDPDDAKNILEEVLTEGSESQKERAKEMMQMLP